MKTFSKDSLKVGDRVIINHLGGTHTVCEVCDNSFAVLECGTFNWNTYAQATEEGWIILPEEEERKNTFAVFENVSTIYTHAVLQNKIIEAIIKNNNELIEKIQTKSCIGYYENLIAFGKKQAINIIQSKNDSLSKE